MKLKDIHNFNKLWDTKITKEMKKNIDIKNALYWLSGGDVEWIDNNIYNIKWENCYSLFIQKFEKKLLYINEQVTTLGECKEKLIQELSLPIIYEFALKNKLIK